LGESVLKPACVNRFQKLLDDGQARSNPKIRFADLLAQNRLERALALLVFDAAAVFLFAELTFGRRLRVVHAMLHRFCCTKEGEDRLEVVIG
jgi:hypothetical protein